MSYIKQFLLFWYHFIIGDNWRIALGVIVGLTVSGFLVHWTRVQLWWLLPISVAAMLTLSLWLSARAYLGKIK